MGEIAEMMLEGTLCAGCGVYIGCEDNDFPTYCSEECMAEHELVDKLRIAKKGKNKPKSDWKREFDILLDTWGFIPTPLRGAKEHNKKMRRSLKSFISQELQQARQEGINKVEAVLKDRVLYIGEEIPRAVAKDKRSKCIFLGCPNDILLALKKREGIK